MKGPFWATLLLLATVAAHARAEEDLALPHPGELWHGVYPGGPSGEEDDITPERLASYEALAGKRAAWVFFSDNWYRDHAFPATTAEWVRAAGSIPYVRMMLRSSPEQYRPETTYAPERIIGGAFDEDLRAWFRAAADFATPLIVEYGTEMNGEWFGWNGRWHGGGETAGYGDPALPDGPERFRDAYRHIIDLSRQEGARNITWVFHANDVDAPAEPWNSLENYYPGDDWIDWLAVSAYGVLTPMDLEWTEFRDKLDAAYPRLAALAPDKPIIVAEFGVARSPYGEQAAWAERALTDLLAQRWPRIVGFSWWNEAWQNDDDRAHDTTMRLEDNPALAAAFERLVGGDARVLGGIEPTAGP